MIQVEGMGREKEVRTTTKTDYDTIPFMLNYVCEKIKTKTKRQQNKKISPQQNVLD